MSTHPFHPVLVPAQLYTKINHEPVTSYKLSMHVILHMLSVTGSPLTQ